ncbi:MAG: hypothetical protein ACFE9T_12010 [Promethearchaeota archaeon]
MDKKSNEEFDENGFDPTKEAFFSDLIEMEEEIASEAYDLVEHALNLIASKFYDDGIETLRQAIGLYSQINREEEVKAINEKISEIYILKEQAFREIETKPEEITTELQIPKFTEEIEITEIPQEIEPEKIEPDKSYETEKLISEAQELVKIEDFEGALDKYDEAIIIFEEIDKPSEVERIYKLIEECYNKKLEFLRRIKKGEVSEEIETHMKEEIPKGEEILKEDKIKTYLEAKKYEEELSSRAYDLLGQATELANNHQYDESLGLYEEGLNLFIKLDWQYEINKVRTTIEQLEKEKEVYLRELNRAKLEKEKELKLKAKQEAILEKQVKEVGKQQEIAKMEKIKEHEIQKLEDDYFQVQIANMVNEAAKMAREYEVAMKKALKKGTIVEKSPYHEIIQIYEKVRNLLIEKGWKEQVQIYTNQINIYYEKLEKDKKLRQIEAEKLEKQKAIEETQKVKEESVQIVYDTEKAREIEETRKKEMEIQKFIKEIDEMVNNAEREAREYEIALRKGQFDIKCPYPEIISTYQQVRNMLLEKGLKDDAVLYTTQIQIYEEKLEKDRRLREIEAQKIIKQKEVEEMHKIEKELKPIKLEKEKLDDEQKFEESITEIVDEAERLARDYEVTLKKAKNKIEIIEKNPYNEIIEKYKIIKEKLYAKGWKEQAEIYTNQIKIYQEKLEKDKKLREIELLKLQKEKALDQLYKVQKIEKEIPPKRKDLTVIKKKKEEEEFEKKIAEMVNKAEKLVRDYEISLKKAKSKAEIIKKTPYPEIIETYKQIRDEVYAKGWKEQAEIYTNQIKIYEEKLEKDKKLLEIELQKVQKDKELEDFYKVQKGEKEVPFEQIELKAIEEKKEEEEFEKKIAEMINKAEKLVRDYELSLKRSKSKAEIIKKTPYPEIIETYKQIRDKVSAKGWKEQAEIYTSQIKIYEEKLEKDKKLLEIELQKVQKEKELEEFYKVQKGEKEVPFEQIDLKAIEKKKEEEEFEKKITEMINKAEKLARDFDLSMKRAMKEGKVIKTTPYPEIIEIYKQIRDKIYTKGWREQAEIYGNQIKIYQEKLDNFIKLQKVEADKIKRQREVEEMHKIKTKLTPIKPEELKEEDREEDLLLDKAMELIDEGEKMARDYEVKLKGNILSFKSPYEEIISYYEEARKIFHKIGWKDEANRLINTIIFYKDKKEKDDKLRVLEKNKLEASKLKTVIAKPETEEEIVERHKKIIEFERKRKEETKTTEEIFAIINNAEKLAQEYEINIKEGILKFDCPYDEIIEIYRNAKKNFEEIGWTEEANKLVSSINYYKEKLEKDKKIRVLEATRDKKRERELLQQQKLIEKARLEQIELQKQRKESLLTQKAKDSELEMKKSKAFDLMDRAKAELKQKNFDKAIELYKESEKVFSNIKWKEGIDMVQDSITLIKRKKEKFEMRQKLLKEKELKKVELEEQLEEKFVQTEELRKLHQEQKKKEFLKIQKQKEWEKEISEEAYELLEQGTALLERKKFDDAHEKYVKARELFNRISWQREVSRINNELLFNLQREKKKYEILEDIDKKRVEEKEKIEQMMLEALKERRETEKRKKKEKFKKLKKEEIEEQINKRIRKAKRLIEDYKYNKAVQILKREIDGMKKRKELERVSEMEELIQNIITQSKVPIITLEEPDDNENLEKFELAYTALDKAQASISNQRYMKTVSELNEAIYNLNETNIGKKYLNDVIAKMKEFKEKLGKKLPEVKPEKEAVLVKTELDDLKTRIAKRREERKKKVLELLKKRKE